MPQGSDGFMHAGLDLAWFSLRWPDPLGEIAEIRFGFAGKDGKQVLVWGEREPRAAASVQAHALLDFLVAEWPMLAGEFTSSRTAREGVSSFTPSSRGRPLQVERVAGALALSCGSERRDFGGETVLVSELLLALGNVLADQLEAIDAYLPKTSAWRAAQSATDLLPMRVEGGSRGEDEILAEEADWYAAKMKVDPAGYRLAAVDVHARQCAFAAGSAVSEPSREEWLPDRVPEGLDRDDVIRRAKEAAQATGVSFREFVRDAVHTRNMDARQRVIFRR